MFGSVVPSRLSFALCGGFAVLCVLFSPLDSEAQLTRGSVTGTVTDPAHLPISDVAVTLRNDERGHIQTLKTNEVGIYRFTAVEPGTYSVEFRKKGFEIQETPVEVTTALERTINRVLPISRLETIIVVPDTGGLLDKTGPTIEQTYSSRVVTEVPTSDVGALVREVTRVALLGPAITKGPGQNGFSIGGQRPRNLNVMCDGGDCNEGTVTLPIAEIPAEAIREIQVQIAPFKTEFGRNTGGQLNIITKSGSNTLSGSVWDYYTGNWLEPLTLANKRSGVTETPRSVHNRGGFDLGGPIVTSRTFFYALVQGNVRRESPNALNATAATIPTPSGYQALLTAPLGSGQLDPSRQAMLNALSFLPEIHSQLAAGCPLSNPLCAYSSATSPTVNGTPIEVGNIRIPLARPASVWDIVTRIDHVIGPNDRLFLRYNLNRRDQPDTQSNLQFGQKWSGGLLIPAHSLGLSYIKIAGSTFVNEGRFSFHRVTGGFEERDPLSATINLTSLFTIGGLSSFPQSREEDVYQLQNVSTWQKGRHAIKFGADIRRNVLFNNNAPNSKGTWTFTSLETFMNNTGSLTQAVSLASLFTAKQWNQYYFFQDDFRPVRDLTINLGIRYENATVPFGMFGATLPEVLAVGVPGPAQRDNNNWAPRVGFAYSPSSPSGIWERLLGPGRTVIRGGFGMSYDVLFYNILTITASTAYPSVTQTDNNLVNVFPTLLPKTAAAAPVSPTATFANTPTDIQNPTTHYWSLSVQRQFGREFTLEVGYLGNRSYHALRQNQANPAVLTQAQADIVLAGGSIPSTANRRINPAWGSRQIVESTGKGEYHAGYIRIDKRLSRGLLVGANYTWSATFSDSEEITSDPTISAGSPQVPQNFGNLRSEWSRSIFDRPHRFSAHYIYEIPWFANSSRALRQVFGGWQIAGFTEVQSGQPFSIRVGVDAPGNAASSTFPPGRPNFNPGGILILDPVTHDMRTFSIPCNGTGLVTAPRSASATCAGSFLANTMPGGGTLGRNTFRGPSFQNWNISLMKRIALDGDRLLEIRSDFLNAWNHNNFGIPDNVMNSSTFGSNTGALVTDQRQILLSAKVKF